MTAKRREYVDINPHHRRRMPKWVAYAGLASLVTAAVAVVGAALGQ